jgi:polyhydroxyalkanoate synthesis regulator phasin
VLACTIAGMDDRAYWQKELREAEQELDAATRRSDVDAAAKRLRRAKAELKTLEAKQKRSTRRGSGAKTSGDAS